jgi:Na+/H+ antiporter NhaA
VGGDPSGARLTTRAGSRRDNPHVARRADTQAGLALSGRTAWSRNLATPLRGFLRTETGGAAVLLAGTVAALVWANADASSYANLWSTRLAVELGGTGVALDLHDWVNKGLMTFFFFVVGLEGRREFDMGELRRRRRVALPLLAGVGGMVVPAAIYLACNAGRPTAHGWGAAISTDTAFALGMLALVGRRLPDRLRSFTLTVVVVDDVVALVLIATVYTETIAWWALAAALGLLAAIVATRAAGVHRGLVYAPLGAALWVALLESGVDPVVTGLVLGLLTAAYPAARADLEQASRLFRVFREQPTAELARTARAGVEQAISPNERLQQLWHPWTSYVFVPLFALANAGIAIDGDLLARAFTSPVTLGILAGYTAGKPVGIVATTRLVAWLSRGRLRPPVGWAAVAGGGTIAGIGFTVSLLIAALAFDGERLEEAKVGVLSAALVASAATWLVFRATELLPRRLRVRALLGTSEPLVDLAVPVDPERDHVRGPDDAPVTIVEYGDFQCPYCGQAEAAMRELLAGAGDVRYVWRHLPLADVHPNAQAAAEAAEAAAALGAFWPMHDLLLERQAALQPRDLVRYAAELGLDADRVADELRRRVHAGRVAEDVDGADLSGVAGTLTFFVNGRRHHGAYDIDSLTAAVRAARARAAVVP